MFFMNEDVKQKLNINGVFILFDSRTKKKYFFATNQLIKTIYFLRKRRLGNNFLSKYFLFKNVLLQSPRFENFCSSRNSFNPTFRPNLWPNSDDSLCHVIDSCKIFGSTWGVRSNENKNNLGILQLLPWKSAK